MDAKQITNANNMFDGCELIIFKPNTKKIEEIAKNNQQNKMLLNETMSSLVNGKYKLNKQNSSTTNKQDENCICF